MWTYFFSSIFLLNYVCESEEAVTCNSAGEYYEHEYECEKYYHCGAGLNPVLKTCADGNYFDIRINNCNHMEMVDCTPSSPTTNECLVAVNDDSGYWINITDNDNATCSVIPRDGVTEIVQHFRIDMACMADRINANISSAQSLVHITVTATNISSCPEQKLLFAPKIQSERTCETDILKLCDLVADNMLSNSTCEYTCPCVPFGNRCSLYLIQAQYSGTPMETSSLCEMQLTAVSEL